MLSSMSASDRDALRYYLLKQGGVANDAEFSLDAMHVTRQADLNARLGNLLSRATSLALVPDQRWPAPLDDASRRADVELDAHYAMLTTTPIAFERDVRALRIASALQCAIDVLRAADALATRREPWRQLAAARAVTVRALLDSLYVALLLLAPALPHASAIALNRLGLDVAWTQRCGAWRALDVATVVGGTPFGSVVTLFPRSDKK